jgi:hypothetical protein
MVRSVVGVTDKLHGRVREKPRAQQLLNSYVEQVPSGSGLRRAERSFRCNAPAAP